MIFVLLEIVLTVRLGLIVPERGIQFWINVLRMNNIQPCFVVSVFVFALAVIQKGVGSGGVVKIHLRRGQQIGIVGTEEVEFGIEFPPVKIIGLIGTTVISGIAIGDAVFVYRVVVMIIMPCRIDFQRIGKSSVT